jgi:hypothetical protein
MGRTARGTFARSRYSGSGCYLRPLISKGLNMLAILAVILVVLWLLGFFAFHVTTAAIHILLLIAVVVIVLHFLRGRRSI